MRGAFLRHRRIVGRPQGARFHRDTAARGRFGAVRRDRLFDSAWRPRQSQWGADALADCEYAVTTQPARSASAGIAGVGCRAVPRPRITARALEHFA